MFLVFGAGLLIAFKQASRTLVLEARLFVALRCTSAAKLLYLGLSDLVLVIL